MLKHNHDAANPSESCWNVVSSWTDLEHEHGELLVVFPLLHCCVHIGRRGRQRGAAALAGELPVELCHLLKLLPQVLGDDLGPFCNDKPQEIHQQQQQQPRFPHQPRLQHQSLTYAGIDHVPLLDFSLCDGGVIRTSHLNHPCRAHDWHRVLGQVSENFFFFAQDGDLWHRWSSRVSHKQEEPKPDPLIVVQNTTEHKVLLQIQAQVAV